MSRRSAALAVLAALSLVVAMTTSVSAYGGTVPAFITVTPSHGTFTCGHYYKVHATVLNASAQPIKGAKVTWSILSRRSIFDKVTPTVVKTNKYGRAWVRVKFGCQPGNRRIFAKAGHVRGKAIVHVRIPSKKGAVLGITSKVLPNTSTIAAAPTAMDQPGSGIPVIPILLGLLGSVAFIGRRFALDRR
jgi:hypothetical protein